MADEAHFNRVMSYIDLGKKSGELLIGGARKGDKGFWIEPTIFLNPDKGSRSYREEIFGPVLSIVTFKTEEEAIELANDTNTGLSGKFILPSPRGHNTMLTVIKCAAALYTSDLNRALRVSAKIETGNVSINAPHFPNQQVPFGGFKESGDGKELGKYGLQSFLQTKSILIK